MGEPITLQLVAWGSITITEQSSRDFHKTATAKTWVLWEFPTSMREAQLIIITSPTIKTSITTSGGLREELTLLDNNTSRSMLWPSRQPSTPGATADSNLATVQSIRATLWQETPNSKWSIKTTSEILSPIEDKTVRGACIAVVQDVVTLRDRWGLITPLPSD